MSLSLSVIFSFAQDNRKASISEVELKDCKSCIPNVSFGVTTTLCNLESNDTLTVYYADGAPFDSGWAIGHNAYLDKGWAEKYTVTGNANVIGGVYLLFENSGAATSGGTATGKVYNTAGTGGKPGTSLGSVNIPFGSMVLTGLGPTIFSFGSPVAVTNSFFMTFELGTYTLTGPDTIAVVTTRDGNRSTTNADQNCVLWSDNKWYFELTENYKMKVNYQLCAIVDVGSGVNDYISKGNLNLYAAYPNPASSDITIRFSLSDFSKTAIEIYDAQGKSMIKIDKGNLPKGKYLEKINLASLSAGTYLYSVKTESGTLFSRFSVLK